MSGILDCDERLDFSFAASTGQESQFGGIGYDPAGGSGNPAVFDLDATTGNRFGSLLSDGSSNNISDDHGEYLPDGTFQTYYHEGRTSYSTWCMEKCQQGGARFLLERIMSITNVPIRNYEELQFLRYNHSQKYDVHHDYDGTSLVLAMFTTP